MKKLFIPGVFLFFSLQAYSSDVTLSDETIILAQMLTDPEVQECIRQIEAEYKGHFRIWQIVRRPLNPEVPYEESSAALAAHSAYFFRGSVGGGQAYKGPDAIAVERIDNPPRKYACRIVDKMLY